MSEWQPIETAPTNERVLVYESFNGSFDIHIVKWFNGYWESNMGAQFYPTHWMPLPEPPKGENE